MLCGQLLEPLWGALEFLVKNDQCLNSTFTMYGSCILQSRNISLNMDFITIQPNTVQSILTSIFLVDVIACC